MSALPPLRTCTGCSGSGNDGCRNSPWGAVAPLTTVGQQELQVTPDSVQLATPAPESQAPNAGSLAQTGGTGALEAAQAGLPAPLMVVILGNEVSSKKDQAETIARNLGLVHISMGGLIGQEVASGSALGLQLQRALDKGQESPAVLLYDLIHKRLGQEDCREKGFILDAYPEDLKSHKAEDLLDELKGLRLISLSAPQEDCPECIPVIELARQRGALYEVDDETDRQSTADVLEALVDNFSSLPVHFAPVDYPNSQKP